MLELNTISFRTPESDAGAQSLADLTIAGIVYGFQHPARLKGTTFRYLLSIAAGSDDGWDETEYWKVGTKTSLRI